MEEEEQKDEEIILVYLEIREHLGPRIISDQYSVGSESLAKGVVFNHEGKTTRGTLDIMIKTF